VQGRSGVLSMRWLFSQLSRGSRDSRSTGPAMLSRKVQAPPATQRTRRQTASTAARQAAGWARRQRRTAERVSAAHTSTPRATTTARALRSVWSGLTYLREQGHHASLTILPILGPKSFGPLSPDLLARQILLPALSTTGLSSRDSRGASFPPCQSYNS
jgi:hypothetical protein